LTLPDFLIVGAMRSGTTALATALGQHPELFMTPKKELHYFDVNIDNGIDWYESQFVDGTGSVVGEATPSYMFDDFAVQRLSSTLPGAKLIAILRDPVDRAYSHYWHNRQRGRETLEFEAALEAESSRLHSTDALDRLYFSYFSRGLYHRQLEYLCRFFPRSQLLTLIFEEFREDQATTLRQVWRFLGVNERFVPERRLNINAYRGPRWRGLTGVLQPQHGEGRTVAAARRLVVRVATKQMRYPPMPSPTRRALGDRYAEPNEQLASWLGRSRIPWPASGALSNRASRSLAHDVGS
jgi:hypothetical protein